MKKMITGMIALLIPVFMFAQATKDAQDLNQVRQKVNSLEKSTQQIKSQVYGINKTLQKMDQAEAAEKLAFHKYDSLVQAAQDTVKTYSARLQKEESNTAEIESALRSRTIASVIILIVAILLIVVYRFIHRSHHRKEIDDLLEKLKAQREEREQRIADIKAMIAHTDNEFGLLKKETEERISALGSNLTQVDKNLQKLIGEKSASLEAHIKDHIAKFRKDLEEGTAGITKKVDEVHTLVTSKIHEIGQKVADSGKKLDEQIHAAHKKADELKTVLAKEIEAIRSKFE